MWKWPHNSESALDMFKGRERVRHMAYYKAVIKEN